MQRKETVWQKETQKFTWRQFHSQSQTEPTSVIATGTGSVSVLGAGPFFLHFFHPMHISWYKGSIGWPSGEGQSNTPKHPDSAALFPIFPAVYHNHAGRTIIISLAPASSPHSLTTQS
jgi:hypothetical protein